jgi:hypothetical protein
MRGGRRGLPSRVIKKGSRDCLIISFIENFGFVNVLNLHRIDLARKYHTHLQREIEKEETREKEWKNSH